MSTQSLKQALFIVLLPLIMVFFGTVTYAQTVYPDYRDGEIYVKINDNSSNLLPLYDYGNSTSSFPSSLQNIMNSYGITKIASAFKQRNDIKVDRIFRIQFTDTAGVENLIQDFYTLPDIDFAEKVPLYKTTCTNEQPGFWNAGNRQNWSLYMTNVCDAYALLNTTSTLTPLVAVVDNEFMNTHPDFGPNFTFWDEADSDPNTHLTSSVFDHGTHVAGIAGAVTDNGIGKASIGGGNNGTQSYLNFLCIKATHDFQPICPFCTFPHNQVPGGVGSVVDVGYDAIEFAAQQGARVISCSWGAQTTNNTTTMAQAEQIALDNTLSNHPDFILVVAAGNANTSNPSYPAAVGATLAGNVPATPFINSSFNNRVVAVASTNENDQRSSFSNFGNWVDIAAPGSYIWSTTKDGSYGYKSGTSMATPMVSGLCGLIWYNNPGFTINQVLNCLYNSALDKPGQQLGQGRIDAALALACQDNYNIGYTLNPGRVLCTGNSVTFTQNLTNSTIPSGVVITSYNWSFPGAVPAVSTAQNPANILYSQPGIYPVQCAITFNNNVTQYFNTSIHVVGLEADFISTDDFCINSEQQIEITQVNKEEGFGAVTLNYMVNGAGQTYVNALQNFRLTFVPGQPVNTVQINQVQYANLGFSCPLDIELVRQASCCENNLVVNGDFSAGFTGFTSDYSQNCGSPNNESICCIVSAPYPTYGWLLNNRGNSMYVNGRAQDIQSTPSFQLNPNIYAGAVPPVFQNNNPTPSFANFGLELWHQTGLTIIGNHEYTFQMFSSPGNTPYQNHPLRLRLQLIETGNPANIVYSNTFEIPHMPIAEWLEYNPLNFVLPNTVNCDIVLEQFENFGKYEYDFEIDDIALRIIYPYSITSPLGSNCLVQGTTTTLTANPPVSGVSNYVWTGPPGGIVGVNNTQTITVQLPGTYTVTSTNSSPQASNCTTLTATYVVNGVNLSLNVQPPCALPATLTATAISSTTIDHYNLNGGANQTGNTFTVNSLGTYTISVTDANGCTATATAVVTNSPNSIACCNPAYAFPQFTDPDATTLGNLNGQTLGINGTLTVNTNMTITNSTINMAPDAKIVLDPGVQLTITNSTLNAACNHMWKGIRASNANNQVTITSSTLRDMEQGVVLEYGAKINAQDNTFIDNYVGMQMVNTPVGYNMASGQCIVRRNNFTSDISNAVNLLAPYVNHMFGEHGIVLTKCHEAEIGFINWSNLGQNIESNTFQYLRNGIFIGPAYGNLSFNLTSLNNRFLDIYEGSYFGQFFAQPVSGPASTHDDINNHTGSGIFCAPPDIWGMGPAPTKQLNVYGYKTFSHFERVNKGICVQESGLAVQGNKFEDCHQGIIAKSSDLLNVGSFSPPDPGVSTNDFNEVLKGITLIGHPSPVHINENQIHIKNLNTTGYLNLTSRMGIEMNGVAQTIANNMQIAQNDIFIPTIYGTGIRISNYGPGINASDNRVYFTTTNAMASAPLLRPFNRLLGIHSIRNEQHIYNCNEVKSTFGAAVYAARSSTGILLHHSKNSTLTCNWLHDIRYGMEVWSDCQTGQLRVQGNHLENQWLGILFRHLATEGSLGDIGNTANDNHNHFYNTDLWTAPNNNHYEIFRFTNNPIGWEKIYTMWMNLSSGAYPANGWYNISNNLGATVYNCPTTNFCNAFVPIPIAPGGVEDEAWADAVAADGIPYSEFMPVAEGMDERELFAQLSFDPAALAASPDYQSFYSAELNTYTDEMLQVDLLLAQIYAATTLDDYQNLILQAQGINAGMINGDGTENNEKLVNDHLFTVLLSGPGALSQANKDWIATLAAQCPYLEGQAVYKARMLYGMLSPDTDFDDMTICNNAGLYKNGKGLFDDENALLNQLPDNDEGNKLSKLTENSLILYPNPANDKVFIEHNYKQAGTIQVTLYDQTGKKVQEIQCRSCDQKIEVSLNAFVTGIYTYKVFVDGLYKHAGKLNIVK